jgi:hypothetical protein
VTESKSSGSDPIGDLQRWLMRSGARSLSREVKGQFRRATGGGSDHADVWETATAEPPPSVGEAPECAWCPLCRAARRAKESGPGFASQAAAASGALFSVAQDAVAAFEATLSARPQTATGKRSPEGTGWPTETGQARPAGQGSQAGTTETADTAEPAPRPVDDTRTFE